MAVGGVAMSMTTANIAYAAQLKGKLLDLPSVGLKAAAPIALEQAAARTVQDSGEAAYNWDLAWDGKGMSQYVRVKGIHPVGEAWEKRGTGHPDVVHAVTEEAEAAIPTEQVQSVTLYNPLDDPEHEFAADIQTAGTHAIDPSPMNHASEIAINAYLRRSN